MQKQLVRSILRIFHNADYGASNYEFDTTRKAIDIAQSLIDDPISPVAISDPSVLYELAEEVIAWIHSEKYVTAVRTGKPRQLAQTSSFSWDPGIYVMARAHVAGMIAATHDALTNNRCSGSLSSGMHHAAHDRGAGYCTFNGLAAAIHAARQLGAGRILCLDLDAHAGGGTWDIISRKFDSDVVQVDVTVSAFDTWQPEGESRLDTVSPDGYRKAVEKALDYASTLEKFDFIVYNAGVDVRNSGVSENDLRIRERLVRTFIGDTPAIFGLAGGYTWGRYTIDDVVAWHRLTIARWAEAS